MRQVRINDCDEVYFLKIGKENRKKRSRPKTNLNTAVAIFAAIWIGLIIFLLVISGG